VRNTIQNSRLLIVEAGGTFIYYAAVKDWNPVPQLLDLAIWGCSLGGETGSVWGFHQLKASSADLSSHRHRAGNIISGWRCYFICIWSQRLQGDGRRLTQWFLVSLWTHSVLLFGDRTACHCNVFTPHQTNILSPVMNFDKTSCEVTCLGSHTIAPVSLYPQQLKQQFRSLGHHKVGRVVVG
jgi:hypothetical protein